MDYSNVAGMLDVLSSRPTDDATLRAAVRAVLHRRDTGQLDDEDTTTVLLALGLAEEAPQGTVRVPCGVRERRGEAGAA